MQYEIGNIIIKDLNDEFKDLLEYKFFKQTDKQKLDFITNNIRINYKDSTDIKFNKIKQFLIKNEYNIKDIELLDKFVVKLLSKLVFQYKYLLK